MLARFNIAADQAADIGQLTQIDAPPVA